MAMSMKALKPAPADALMEFLGMGPGNDSVNLDAAPYRDPSLELASLRGNREGELQDRVARGDHSNGADNFLSMLEKDIHGDPVTGDASLAKATKAGENYNAERALLNPGTPENELASQQNRLGLEKSRLEHPNPNVDPFSPAPKSYLQAGDLGSPAPGAAPQGNPSQGISGPVPAPAGVDPERWAKGTQGLPPDTIAKIASLLQYHSAAPGGNVLARPEWSGIVGRANSIDPTFDVTQFDARKKLRENATSGETMQKMRALNALSGHSADLSHTTEELNNADFGGSFGNSAVNALEKFFNVGANAGGGKATEYDKTNGLVTAELGKFLAGGGPATNELRESVGGGVNSDSTHSSQVAGIDSTKNLARKQWHAMLQEMQGVPGLEDLLRKQLDPATLAFIDSGSSAQREGGAGSAQEFDWVNGRLVPRGR